MKTQQEIEKMKDEIRKLMSDCDEQLQKAKNETVYNLMDLARGRLQAQYNILLEVLK